MKFHRTLFLALVAVFLCVPGAAWADIQLPSPRMDNKTTLFEALKLRSSAPGGDFPTAPLTLEDLSDILWATTGLNRGTNGWVVPMSEGLPPYVDVYVATNEGVFLYGWGNNSLGEISKEDIRAKIGAQRFVASAPCSLILVGNSKALSEFKDESVQKEFAHVAAGAMTQDTYLAAAALNVGARYIHSMKTDEIKSALNLPEDDFPICLMIMGK